MVIDLTGDSDSDSDSVIDLTVSDDEASAAPPPPKRRPSKRTPSRKHTPSRKRTPSNPKRVIDGDDEASSSSDDDRPIRLPKPKPSGLTKEQEQWAQDTYGPQWNSGKLPKDVVDKRKAAARFTIPEATNPCPVKTTSPKVAPAPKPVVHYLSLQNRVEAELKKVSVDRKARLASLDPVHAGELVTEKRKGPFSLEFTRATNKSGDRLLKWFQQQKGQSFKINFATKFLSETKAARYWLGKRKYNGRHTYAVKPTAFANSRSVDGNVGNEHIAAAYIVLLNELAKEQETEGYTISTNDADAESGTLITWSACSEQDLKAYKAVTAKFKETNALTWTVHPMHGRIFKFNKNGTRSATIRRILEAVHGSSISWGRTLIPDIVSIGYNKQKKYGRFAGTVQLKEDMDMTSPGAGVIIQNGHMACIYSVDGKEWRVADPWKQPPYTKKPDIDQFARLAELLKAKGLTLIHTKIWVAQGQEGSCAEVGMMRAMAAAAAIHAGRKAADVHALTTGLDPAGNRFPDWTDQVACYAKLVHRLVRIYERVN